MADNPSVLQQKHHIDNVVSRMVNADLREVCRQERLAVSGVKVELQKRIRERLERLVQSGDVQALSTLRFRVDNPLAAYRGITQPSASASPSATSRHPPSQSGSNVNPQSHSPHYNSPLAFTHTHGSAANASSRRAPSGSNTSPAAPMRFKSSPFHEPTAFLGSLPIHICQQHRNDAKLTINLSSAQAENLRRDSRYRVLIYCGENPATSQPSLVAFPANVELRVNNQEVKTNTKGVKGKPGSTRPADITSFLKKQAGPQNFLQITYALTSRAYTVVVHLVEKRSVDELSNMIKGHGVITKASVLAEMRNKAKDTDIIATSTVMSLKDPVSYGRISLPCRGTTCTHNQCFDAVAFLQLQEQAPVWACPICNKHIAFEHIAVDEYVQDILENTSSSTEQVTIEPDGTWSYGSKSNLASGGPTRKSSLDDDDDEDLIEIFDWKPKGVKNELPITPASLSTVPEAATGASGLSRTPGSRGQKRPSEVIDLTLSDDERPLSKRPAPSSLNQRGYNQQPTPTPSYTPGADQRYAFQLENSRPVSSTSTHSSAVRETHQTNRPPPVAPHSFAAMRNSPSPFMALTGIMPQSPSGPSPSGPSPSPISFNNPNAYSPPPNLTHQNLGLDPHIPSPFFGHPQPSNNFSHTQGWRQ